MPGTLTTVHLARTLHMSPFAASEVTVKQPAPLSADLIRTRIYGEYLEMPGLRLTCAQAQRLWGLDQQTCLTVLDSLISDGFLQRGRDGLYARLTDGPFTFPAVRMAKVPPVATRREISRRR